MFIKEGIINECSIEGSDQMMRISKKINGCRHMIGDLSDIFRKENLPLTGDEIYNFF
jgi:hypothetical protein